MAQLTQRRSQNVQGNFYVDTTCIDCDTCRWMAPEVFIEDDDQSAVYHQPESEQQHLKAMQALLACPTASIGTVEKPTDIKAVQSSFPIPIAENVYHCGYHAESSFGAASYLIVRPQGNILVDSPRWASPLVKQIEELGGVSYLYLTHRDDVADHQKYANHFHCQRILHQDEINANTQDVEIQLSGTEPYQLAEDLLIIPVPGHTKGHTVLLYNNRFLFTGDHLAWSDEYQHLIAFRRACWYSWPELRISMKKLTDYSFEWVLPGHGRRYHAENAEVMQQQLQKCIAWMETVA
ncbi:MBL fold metallo-hydrolase [Desertifilum sp. FACHB-1129]|uniref:MBL fold metallo-hydrolase n=1 Tax=Desertifilum tharense IPPAS B-1220 TaxID=1781255 RepID=A0A1E5QDC7_9CYAN|nr:MULTISPECIES: MBL fold metallo-hydrolase [unclassified Desertifilum]MDA0212337.1 MBL fold metallo-hydrolase [Cyanobacteria bacterium FC1]OEJ72665.1 MBL fold metallo-hydrolase [Desertifilum tharense IPPAS B-1220]MBD2311332.1 MBL fold metallo-hydrolase [Desertifilum sp. FACHB-1129]MBD2321578.1 MBL fold metallo-hydrolase [Desertifilum sp. FACHB-866]MBD2331705.1 MBL fold metallo-hydrolase [Desertifilum sp. FACHB-868]